MVLVVLAVFAYTAARRTGTSKPHSVTLTWKPAEQPSGVVIAGYDIYRRSGPTDNFVSIASRVACCSYVDKDVEGNHVYSYVVRSVDSTGKESRDSTSITAKVP